MFLYEPSPRVYGSSNTFLEANYLLQDLIGFSSDPLNCHSLKEVKAVSAPNKSL